MGVPMMDGRGTYHAVSPVVIILAGQQELGT